MIKTRASQEELHRLYQAVLALENEEECKNFFDDICTISEINSISQRLEVAKLLSEEETFAVIGEKTGASSATISRVNRCLQYGDGGYRTVLERINKKGE